MMKSKVLLTSLLFLMSGIYFSIYGQEKRPNIVLIMADDMGFETLGAYGSAVYETPNLDKMAENGVKFTNMFSQPLCTPSRVKIMTGKYNYKNYTDFGYLDPSEITFGNMLQNVGYNTFIAGKWQLNGFYNQKVKGWDDVYRPYHFGFDEFALWQITKTRADGERYADPLIVHNGVELPRDKDAYGPDIFSNMILDFIDRKKDEDDPFFVYYPMVLPHDPFVATPDSPEWEDEENRYEEDNAFFEDMVKYTDKLVGNIIEYLEENNLAENTLVLFTADNGTSPRIQSDMVDGSVVEGRKGQMVDWGIRVPLIAYWAGKTEGGTVNNNMLDFSDVLPTLIHAAGIDFPEFKEIDGQSFLPQILGKEAFAKDYVYMYYKPNWVNHPRGVFARTEGYKLYGDGRFYNVEEDIKEESPLVEDELNTEEKTILQKLKNVLEQKPVINDAVAPN